MLAELCHLGCVFWDKSLKQVGELYGQAMRAPVHMVGQVGLCGNVKMASYQSDRYR